MNQPMLEKLFQTANKRDLNEAELTQMEDWLASNPVERAELEAVDQLLNELPDEPVASNFTTRVLQEIRSAEDNSPARVTASWWKIITPRFSSINIAATAVAMVILIGGVVYQSHLNKNRVEVAASLQAVATFAEMFPVVLNDFDAIEVIGQADPIDEELWAALK